MQESYWQKQRRLLVHADWQPGDQISIAMPQGGAISHLTTKHYLALSARSRFIDRLGQLLFIILIGGITLMITAVGPVYIFSGSAQFLTVLFLMLIWLFCLHKSLYLISFLRWASRHK